MPTISVEQFEELLSKICDKETSSDPKGWSPENPLWGHCAVVSLIAQNMFGGELLRASLEGTKFAEMRSHYWNKLPFYSDKFPFGEEKDFTALQFGGDYPPVSFISEKRERSYVLSNAETVKRYKLLAWRLAEKLNQDGPLFKDKIYRKCFYNALDSPCQKMKFGCVLRYYRDYERIGTAYWEEVETCNSTIEPLKSMCEPTCIRFGIPSRTESMIGACGHAEESALFKAAGKFIPLGGSEIYVAGVYSNGLPYIKTENEFTCLRCAVQLYRSRIRKVFVPVINGWQALTGEECVKTARAYAMKEKTVSEK